MPTPSSLIAEQDRRHAAAAHGGRPPSSEAGLERVIGPWGLATNAVNLTIGAGIFALPAVVAAMLGPAAVLAYLVCAALMGLVLACFAEVGSRVTRSGGAVAYVEEAFGPMAGFLAWVSFVVVYSAGSDAAIAHVVVGAAGAAWAPLGGAAASSLLLAAIFACVALVNVRGVRQGLRLSAGMTIAKLLPLLLLVALGVFAVRWRALTWTRWPSFGELGAASLVLFYAFMGPESALGASGEIRDPRRTVPRGLFLAVLTVTLLYLAVQTTAQGVLGADLARESDAPLRAVAARVAGSPGGLLIVAGTIISGLGTISADLLNTPRAYLVAARDGMLPRSLGRTHPRFRTPWLAIIVQAALALALALSGGFRALATISSISVLLVHLTVAAAALRLRYRPGRTEQEAAPAAEAARPGTLAAESSPGGKATPAPAADRPLFRTPGGPLVPVLAIAIVAWLLAQSTALEAGAMAGVLATSAGWYLLRRRALARS